MRGFSPQTDRIERNFAASRAWCDLGIFLGCPPLRNNVDRDNRNNGMTSTVVNAPKEVADVLRTSEWIVIKNTSRQQLDGDHGTVFIGPAVRHQQLYAQAKPMSTGHVAVPDHGTLPFDRVSCPGVKECPECHAILPTKSKVCAVHPKLTLVARPSEEARCEGMRVGKRRHSAADVMEPN